MPPLREDENDDSWTHWSKFVVKTLERLDTNITRIENLNREIEAVYHNCLIELERSQNVKNIEFATSIRELQIRVALIAAGAAAAVSTIVSIVVLVIFK